MLQLAVSNLELWGLYGVNVGGLMVRSPYTAYSIQLSGFLGLSFYGSR